MAIALALALTVLPTGNQKRFTQAETALRSPSYDSEPAESAKGIRTWRETPYEDRKYKTREVR